jgi:hypothetical protein
MLLQVDTGYLNVKKLTTCVFAWQYIVTAITQNKSLKTKDEPPKEPHREQSKHILITQPSNRGGR